MKNTLVKHTVFDKKTTFSTLVANWVKMVAEGRQNGTDVSQNGANGCKICLIAK